MTINSRGIAEFSDGEVVCWLEQDSVLMLKFVTTFGDPVELGVNEAKDLVQTLLEFVKRME